MPPEAFLAPPGGQGRRGASQGGTLRRAASARDMKLHYYPRRDSLYIELREAPAAETPAITGGLNADFRHERRRCGPFQLVSCSGTSRLPSLRGLILCGIAVAESTYAGGKLLHGNEEGGFRRLPRQPPGSG